ncbi:54S ribosomal protein L38, mitochondrial [Malassezia cuniculi]|uniref:Large ribosomal subunit protein uL14m n=1 Tax=Malassezia cuniculi TaxID=948313 RepID=A0AAF0F0X2_9BASI|nr:54S ribosomal protein L38, mitochondrial [Malassezia cuniculi]
MLGLKATMSIIDNSGGLVAECINVLRYKSSKGLGRVGDEVVVVVQKAKPIPSNAIPGSGSQLKVRRGDVRRAVIVRTKKETQRSDGRVVKFDDNACILLNNRREPLGTRVNGVVSSELRERGWGKILSLAPKVV